jgi:hypothetical protein
VLTKKSQIVFTRDTYPTRLVTVTVVAVTNQETHKTNEIGYN